MSGETISFADIGDEHFDELLRLTRAYYREARRCEAANAHLAGCAMLGASLEASLMAMVHCFADDVAALVEAPKVNGRIRSVLTWKLSELLRVAKRLQWLPAQLDHQDAWDHKRAQVGDYAEVVRQLRNLLHPARYLADHSSKRVTKRHLALSFDTLAATADHLHRKLVDAIAQQLQD
jgi:hypothetical protein